MTMKPYSTLHSLRQRALDERGISFMTVMMITLMAGALGVAALTMTSLENSTAGAMRMVEEGTGAAESCVGMGIKVIQQTMSEGPIPTTLIAPSGPVPAGNVAFLTQEIHFLRNSPDVAWGGGAAPNITMNVNNYVVNGDIDFQFNKYHPGGGDAMDYVYRVDCQAVNAATGTTSHVIAVYQCLRQPDGDSCTPRF